MRFYPYSAPVRRSLIALWSLLLLATPTAALLTHRPWHAPWHTTLWIVLAATQLLTLLFNFWELTPTALVQHGLFFRRVIPAADLLYAGPVGPRPFHFLFSRSVQVSARNVATPLLVNPGPARADFLQRLRQLAPSADIVA